MTLVDRGLESGILFRPKWSKFLNTGVEVSRKLVEQACMEVGSLG